MRALDGFSERQARDGNHDKNACSRALLTESQSIAWIGMANMLQSRERDSRDLRSDREAHNRLKQERDAQKDGVDPKDTGMGQRDKMALASIAFCSPLMLLSMGATMAVMDDFKLNREAKIEQSLRNRLQMRQGRLITDLEQAPKRNLSMSFDATGKMKVEATAIKPKKDKAATRPDKPVKFYPQPEKSWLKASKLLKQKQALMDLLEKHRGQMQLSKVSAIVSQIEELDKALKKMGC